MRSQFLFAFWAYRILLVFYLIFEFMPRKNRNFLFLARTVVTPHIISIAMNFENRIFFSKFLCFNVVIIYVLSDDIKLSLFICLLSADLINGKMTSIWLAFCFCLIELINPFPNSKRLPLEVAFSKELFRSYAFLFFL